MSFYAQERIYIPKWFYERWKSRLGNDVVVKDDRGNCFIGFIANDHRGTYLRINEKLLRFMYQVTKIGIMKLKVVGEGTFEMKVMGKYLGKIDSNDPRRYGGYWGHDPMWRFFISESMAKDCKPLVIYSNLSEI
jgi:hypothetical protein